MEFACQEQIPDRPEQDEQDDQEFDQTSSSHQVIVLVSESELHYLTYPHECHAYDASSRFCNTNRVVLLMTLLFAAICVPSTLVILKQPISFYLMSAPMIAITAICVCPILFVFTPKVGAYLYIVSVMGYSIPAHFGFAMFLFAYCADAIDVQIVDKNITGKEIVFQLGCYYLFCIILYVSSLCGMVRVAKGESPVCVGYIHRNVQENRLRTFGRILLNSVFRVVF